MSEIESEMAVGSGTCVPGHGQDKDKGEYDIDWEMRERERESMTCKHMSMCVLLYKYIHIFICYQREKTIRLYTLGTHTTKQPSSVFFSRNEIEYAAKYGIKTVWGYFDKYVKY